MHLVAYSVCKQETSDIETLRDRLSANPPSYTVPMAIIAVDDLTRNINSKLDITALPILDTNHRDTSPLKTTMERAICEAFATTLGRDAVDRLDNFFELGGHSLLTVRLVAALRKNVHPEIGVQQICNYPTPAALAETLSLASSASAPGKDA